MIVPQVEFMSDFEKHQLKQERDVAYKKYKEFLSSKGHDNYWTGFYYGTYFTLCQLLGDKPKGKIKDGSTQTTSSSCWTLNGKVIIDDNES